MSEIFTLQNFAIGLYNVVAFSVAVLLMFVVTQATKDLHLRRYDSRSVKSSRKTSFYSAAAFLILSLIFQNYWLMYVSVITTALVATGLVAGAGWILAVSSVSMKSRAPSDGSDYHAPVLTPFRRLISVLRRHS
jgi:hypothetical protein